MKGSRGYSIFHGTMADMTYVQIEAAAKEKAIILLPVGVIEEHGPHLPLGVDAYGSYINAKLVKAELENKGIQALIAPPFYWGMNNCTASFPGSFTVREETMVGLLWDIMASLKRWGFEKVFIINHHYDEAHNRALKTAIQKARLDTGIRAYWIIDGFLAKRFRFNGREPYLLIYEALHASPSKYLELHADSYETSLMVDYFADLVDLEMLKSLRSTDLTVHELLVWRRGWDEAREITPQGFFGDPAAASPGRGKSLIEEGGKRIAEIIQEFLQDRYQPPKIE